MNRRKVLRVGLLGIGTGIGVGPLSAQAQQPTVAVSSDECETLTVAYSSRGPPEISVSIGGPENITTTLERGESETLSAVAGTYDVEARPARSRGNSRAIAVEGSPVDVEPCQLTATVDCDSQTLSISNPTDGILHIEFRRYWPWGGLWQLGWRELEPGEVEQFPIDEDIESYYWAHDEEKTGETLPINGEPSPLHIPLGPCEEIDI